MTGTEEPPWKFSAVYDAHFPYVWRAVQHLGISRGQADDVVQEVFLVVYRKLDTFEGRSALRTWIYGIILRVARAQRRKRRASDENDGTALESLPAPRATQPDAAMEKVDAARLVNRLLDGLEDEQREVFVLAELEDLSAPEIAEALEVKLNTVYSRLRLARSAFAEAAARHRARENGRGR